MLTGWDLVFFWLLESSHVSSEISVCFLLRLLVTPEVGRASGVCRGTAVTILLIGTWPVVNLRFLLLSWVLGIPWATSSASASDVSSAVSSLHISRLCARRWGVLLSRLQSIHVALFLLRVLELLKQQSIICTKFFLRTKRDRLSLWKRSPHRDYWKFDYKFNWPLTNHE